MNLQDWIAVGTFAIAIIGVVYAFARRDETLETLKTDLNGLGKKIDKFESRLDRQSEFAVRIDQRVIQLQEECFGTEKSDRLRHRGDDTAPYFSPNSGIEL